MRKKILIFVIGVCVLVAFAGMYKFNYLSSFEDYDVGENKIEKVKIDDVEVGAKKRKGIKDTIIYEDWDKNKDEINDCDQDATCVHTINNYSQSTERTLVRIDIEDKIPNAYSNINILDEKEFNIEVSRELKDCNVWLPRKCMQTKKENENWKVFYGDIHGFNYTEGEYYILKILEREYDFSDSNVLIPTDMPSRVWVLLEVVEHIS